jgi:outer membrane biosynthesis protein TonB
MNPHLRCALLAFSGIFIFGCAGPVDSALLTRRYTPGEASPAKVAAKYSNVIVRSPAFKGPYMDELRSEIRARWLKYISGEPGRYNYGSARVSFAVTTEGSIRDIKFIWGSSKREFARVCKWAVQEATVAPPTENVIEQMKGGELRVVIDFNYQSPAAISSSRSSRR